jgi:hypothetical protein
MIIILTHTGVEESECSTKSQERTVLLISLRLGLRRNFVSVSSSSYDEDIDRKLIYGNEKNVIYTCINSSKLSWSVCPKVVFR